MRCERCGRNEATFHYRGAVNGRVEEVHLCADCAAELGYSAGRGDLLPDVFDGVIVLLPDWEGGLFDGLTPAARRTLQLATPPDERVCETESLLGEDESRALRRERERNALNVRLSGAVAAEDYEAAARLRDELKRLDERS